MKLYFAPMACSLAARIALYEADIDADYHRVNLQTKEVDSGESFFSVAPKGKVAVLALDNGDLLTENPAVLQYIADIKPELKLAPATGTIERYRLQEWLNYISTELHKQILWMSFSPDVPAAAKAFVKEVAGKHLNYLSSQLENRTFLMGENFTVADAYLTWALSLFEFADVSIEPYPVVKSYIETMLSRPAVRRAFAEEKSLTDTQ
jgi:glutathione S-transferase